MVIAIDVIKAVLACFMAGLIFEAHDMVLEGRTLGGIFVMLGHDFPALLGFKAAKASSAAGLSHGSSTGASAL